MGILLLSCSCRRDAQQAAPQPMMLSEHAEASHHRCEYNHAELQGLSPHTLIQALLQCPGLDANKIMCVRVQHRISMVCFLHQLGHWKVICAVAQPLYRPSASAQKSLLKQCATVAACSGQQWLSVAGQKLALPASGTIKVSNDPRFQGELMFKEHDPCRICLLYSWQLFIPHAMHLRGLQASCLSAERMAAECRLHLGDWARLSAGHVAQPRTAISTVHARHLSMFMCCEHACFTINVVVSRVTVGGQHVFGGKTCSLLVLSL